MGKASSSKKVARAAGTGGGRTNRAHTPWTYFSVLAVIVVLGVAFTVTSRQGYEGKLRHKTVANAAVDPKIGGTPWNEGYGVDLCGTFAKPLTKPSTPTGITTAGDGVIHIAPKIKAAAGKNATVGVFASSVGMTLTPNEVRLPGGRSYVNGNDCNGTPARVFVKEYPYAGAPTGVIETADPATIRLANDALLTIAFVPVGQKSKIPPPPASVRTALAKAVSAASAPATTIPTSPTTAPSPTTTTKPKSKKS
jgi:hypothetical protein